MNNQHEQDKDDEVNHKNKRFGSTKFQGSKKSFFIRCPEDKKSARNQAQEINSVASSINYLS